MEKDTKYIVHVGNGPDMGGGITTVMDAITQNYMMKEYNFKMIYTVATNKKILTFLKSLIEIFKLLANRKIELVHMHMATRGSFYRKTLLILLFKIVKVPVVVHSHGAEFQKFYNDLPSLLKKYANYSLNEANYIIALTDSWKEFYSKFIKNKDKIIVIGNFIELPKNEVVRECDSEIVQILFLGRLGHRKGTYDLINSAEILSKKKLKFKIILAGDGEIQKCKQIIKDKNIEEYVEVVGWINKDGREKYLINSDLLTLPSYFESFGVALIEAMSYKLPVVASTGGQMYEVIRENIDGLLVEPGNELQLANALEKLIRNKQLRKQYGENGYEQVRNKFTENVIIPKYKNIYDTIISNKRS